MWEKIRQIEREKEEKRVIAQNMREGLKEMDYQKKQEDFLKYNEKGKNIDKNFKNFYFFS